MKKTGCGTQFLAALLLLGLAGYGINGCFNMVGQSRKAEVSRRDALTPEQRAKEDRVIAEKEAKHKRDVEMAARETRAATFSQKCVRQYLKYPDDASFGFWDIPEVQFNAERDGFFCSGKVKAKNTFGAELTHRWGTIVVLKDGVWQLAKLVIGDERMYESQELLTWLASRKAAVDSAAEAKASMADVERQLTESGAAKAMAESDLMAAKTRLVEVQAAAEARLRGDAVYRTAKEAADNAEVRVKQLREDGDSANLPTASAQWIELKGKAQAIVTRVNNDAGMTAAQREVDDAQRRLNAIGARIIELKRAK